MSNDFLNKDIAISRSMPSENKVFMTYVAHQSIYLEMTLNETLENNS